MVVGVVLTVTMACDCPYMYLAYKGQLEGQVHGDQRILGIQSMCPGGNNNFNIKLIMIIMAVITASTDSRIVKLERIGKL